MRFFLAACMVLVLLISGCNDLFDGQDPIMHEGLKLDVVADPSPVFAGSKTGIFVEFENTDTKPLNDVIIDVFYTGIMTVPGSSVCKKSSAEVEPGELMLLSSCYLDTPPRNELVSAITRADVRVSLNFSTTLDLAQIVEMISKDEYELMVRTGNWKTKPGSYKYIDKNIELLVEFSDNLPIVVREGADAYIYFTIKNIGGGYLSDLETGDITITDDRNIIDAECLSFGVLPTKDDVLPRIACKLNLPSEIEYLSNYPVIISLNYDYELRKGLYLEIVK